ncbi:MAG: hypothetical protein CM15mP8_2290 [Methanobacteriota archaeon]|nr:MAG: hypothetical protein CM15mP8_2290 [Euryarchaeota archaeon]
MAAKMESEHQYVMDGFNDFNEFDIELLTILRDTFEDPAWEAQVMHYKIFQIGQPMPRYQGI